MFGYRSLPTYGNGGALYATNLATQSALLLIMTSCTAEYNNARAYGGVLGLYGVVSVMSGNVLHNNSAPSGGAISITSVCFTSARKFGTIT